MITKDMTVAEAIKDNSAIIQVLSDEGIDFCCKGAQPLSKATEEKNIDLPSFIDLLNRQKAKVRDTIDDAMGLTGADLIDYIVKTHHVYELKLLSEIDDNLRKLVNVHYKHHGEALSEIYKVFESIKAEMVPHFAKEEQKEFPEFIDGKPMDVEELKEEHEAVGELLEKLVEVTDHYLVPADGCMTYKRTFELMADFEADVHRHIFLENSVLFEEKAK